MSNQSKYDQFMSSYSGKELLKEHKLTDYGVWKVRGGDDNCDFGGSHYMPELGLFEGNLKVIIEYAVEMQRFWSWGPGDITLVSTPIKIDETSLKRNLSKIAEVKALEARLKELKAELKGVI